MRIKSVGWQVKKVGEKDGLEPGEFEAIVSVFGNKDSYGDVVMPGAFKDSLAEWATSGFPIPVYYSHRMDDPDFNIGHVSEAREVKADELGYPHPAGLYVKAVMDLDTDGTGSKARQVYKLLKGGRLKEFSFAYDVDEGGWAKRKVPGTEIDEEYYELRKLSLYEVGPTPIGANHDTELLGVKSMASALLDGIKKGRVLSAKNEASLREARDAIDAVLSSLGTEDDEKSKVPAEERTQQESAANVEDPDTGNTEEPKATGAVNTILASIAIRERE